nr:MAG: ABC transporter substrate-binding protein [Caldicoprobacter oshimai]
MVSIKKKYPLVCMMLIIVITAFLLMGCTSKTDEKTEPTENETTEKTEESQPSGETSEGSEDNTSESEIQPIVEQPITLTYYLRKQISAVDDYNEMACWKAMEEKTGIKIEWMHPPEGDRGEHLASMFASQDLPDLIYWDWDSQDVVKLVEEGSIIKLNDLIDQHAPNYKKWLEEYPGTAITLEDGTHYKFAYLTLPEEPTNYNSGLAIRKDWLDVLSLEVPTTIDGWYKVLKAFKEQDPNGNGQPDEIPYCSLGVGRILNLVRAWGIADGFYQENGKVQYGWIRPEMKEFLATMQRWIKEGLINQDYAEIDRETFDSRVVSNLAGAWWVDGVGGWMGNYLDKMKPDNPSVELVGPPYPKVAEGVGFGGPVDDKGPRMGCPKGYGTVITSKNKYVVESVKWLDYHYTREGQLLFAYGIEGESYTMVDGEPRFTEKILKGEEPLGKYCMQENHISMIKDPKAFPQLLKYPEQRAAIELWTEQGMNANYPARWLPPIKLTQEENTRFQEIMNDINAYVEEMRDKFLLGIEPLENFDNFVKTLKDMGIDEAIAIQQAALDRYNSE